jgi:pimeloyl-ACP methyl ester carboxylesterase
MTVEKRYKERYKYCNMLAQALKNSSRPGAFTDGDLDRYRQAWSQPKALTSMLNWYRAVIRKPPTPPANLRITVPTLLIWGARDKFLGREMAQPSIDLCDDGRLVFFEKATHWVQHEAAERVNALIEQFFQGDTTSL